MNIKIDNMNNGDILMIEIEEAMAELVGTKMTIRIKVMMDPTTKRFTIDMKNQDMKINKHLTRKKPYLVTRCLLKVMKNQCQKAISHKCISLGSQQNLVNQSMMKLQLQLGLKIKQHQRKVLGWTSIRKSKKTEKQEGIMILVIVGAAEGTQHVVGGMEVVGTIIRHTKKKTTATKTESAWTIVKPQVGTDSLRTNLINRVLKETMTIMMITTTNTTGVTITEMITTDMTTPIMTITTTRKTMAHIAIKETTQRESRLAEIEI